MIPENPVINYCLNYRDRRVCARARAHREHSGVLIQAWAGMTFIKICEAISIVDPCAKHLRRERVSGDCQLIPTCASSGLVFSSAILREKLSGKGKARGIEKEPSFEMTNSRQELATSYE